MTNFEQVREIIETYTKHGWLLRRVLLCEASNKVVGRTDRPFGDVEVRPATIDAAWFSRPPKAGETAWELRYLGDIPYALLEYVDEEAPEFEDALAGVVERMAEAIAKRHRA